MITSEFKEARLINFYDHTCYCDICNKQIQDGERYWRVSVGLDQPYDLCSEECLEVQWRRYRRIYSTAYYETFTCTPLIWDEESGKGIDAY